MLNERKLKIKEHEVNGDSTVILDTGLFFQLDFSLFQR
jgi:hypothetical protein